MTAPTAPTAPLPSIDLTKYEGHTPGPWEMWTSNSFRRISQRHGKDGGVLYATKHADGVCDLVFSNGGFEGPDAQLMVDAPQLLATLLTMQRERDQWKSRANIAAGIIQTATEQLAASERTCAELRESVERSVAGMNALSIQSVQLVDENARLQAELARLESGDALKK